MIDFQPVILISTTQFFNWVTQDYCEVIYAEVLIQIKKIFIHIHVNLLDDKKSLRSRNLFMYFS